MTALEFAAWMVSHPDAPYNKLVELFEALDDDEQEKIREAIRNVDNENGEA